MTIYEIIDLLSNAGIHFSLQFDRKGAVTVFATVPGERWEIDVFADGAIDFEVFKSPGTMLDLEDLIQRVEQFSDD